MGVLCAPDAVTGMPDTQINLKGGADMAAPGSNSASYTNANAFFRLSNRHIAASLRHSASNAALQPYGFASLGDLALYAMIGTVLSNPSFTYANGGLQNLLLHHTKNRYFSLHGAIRRLGAAGYLQRTRIPEGKNCFHDYYTLTHTRACCGTDPKAEVRCLTAAEGKAFRAAYRPFNAPTEDYTEVSIPMLMDPALSLAAKGLYIVIARYLRLQSYKPDIRLSKDMLRAVCHEGANAFDRLFRELRTAGYLVLTRDRDAKTGYPLYRYTLNKTSDTEAVSVCHAQKQASAAKNDRPAAAAVSPQTSAVPSAARPAAPALSDIRRRIEYGCLIDDYPAERLDCIVSILHTFLSPPKSGDPSNLTLGGISYPRDEITARLSALDSEDIRFVLDTYNDVAKTTKIRSIRGYLTSCLFHAKENLALALDAFAVRTPGSVHV